MAAQSGPAIELAPGVPFHASLDASLDCVELPAQLRFAVGQSFPFWQVTVVCDDGVAVADILANRLFTYRRTRWMEAIDGVASGTTTTSATACTARPSRAGACRTSRIRWPAAARSRPARRRASSACRRACAPRTNRARCAASPNCSPTTTPRPRLFYESQTPVEQAHIAAAFRFELSKLTVPAIRERMVASLRNASRVAGAAAGHAARHARSAAGLPLALQRPVKPEVTKSPALSLMARPGDGSIAGRKVAMFVAPGVDWAALAPVQAALVKGGAAVRLVGPQIGPQASADGETVDADASLENEPGFLFDALVLPAGVGAAAVLARNAHAMDGIRDIYRHCKPMLVMPASASLLQAAGIPGDAKDSGLVMAGEDAGNAIAAFVKAVGAPRAFERETDPPRV